VNVDVEGGAIQKVNAGGGIHVIISYHVSTIFSDQLHLAKNIQLKPTKQPFVFTAAEFERCRLKIYFINSKLFFYFQI
jgi:hypothetical protein